jgi:GTP-binding protein YchF
MEKTQKTIPNYIEVIDIAGLASGASTGEGLGNQFLDAIRNADAIIHIIRCFEDENIIHIHNRIDPVKDKEEVETELQFKDFENVEKILHKVEKAVRNGDKEFIRLNEVLHRIKLHLGEGKSIRTLPMTEDEQRLIRGYNLLTSKQTLYIANINEDFSSCEAHINALKASIETEASELLIINAKLESDIAEIEDQTEKEEYIQMFGLEEPGINRLARAAYSLLNLITFFTVGPKEVRAWPVKLQSKAPQAAGVIHSDFEKGFIRAEMMKYEDYVQYGSEQACKDHAKFHVVGKEYIVEDGDILHIRFNI